MDTLRRYRDPVSAELAAEFLRQHGVIARVLVSSNALPVVAGNYHLVLMDRRQHDDARRLLAGMPDEPVQLETPLEDAATPDLSVLDAALAPPCPRCAATLPLDASLTACPGCGGAVDVAELIAVVHGPDALSMCYPEPDDDLPPETLDEAKLNCPTCGYWLDGLPPRGTCPECGEDYSKSDIIRGTN